MFSPTSRVATRHTSPTLATRALVCALATALAATASPALAANENDPSLTSVEDTDPVGDATVDADATAGQAQGGDLIRAELAIALGAAQLTIETAGARPADSVHVVDAFFLDDLTQPRTSAIRVSATVADDATRVELRTLDGRALHCPSASAEEDDNEITVTVPVSCLGRVDSLSADVQLRNIGAGIVIDAMPDGDNLLLGPVRDPDENPRWVQFVDETNDAASVPTDLHGAAAAFDEEATSIRVALSTGTADLGARLNVQVTGTGVNVLASVNLASNALAISGCTAPNVSHEQRGWFNGELHMLTLAPTCVPRSAGPLDVAISTTIDGNVSDTLTTIPLSLVPARAMPSARTTNNVCPQGQAAPFQDARGNTHENAISCLAARQITQGKGNGIYGVADNLTWGQIASFTARTLDDINVALPTADDAPDAYDDDDGSVHETSLNRLAAAGILTDPDDTRTISLNGTVTRADMARIVSRAAAYAEGTLSSDAPYRGGRYFDDDNGSADENAIDDIAARGIITGKVNRTYGPDEALRRDQMATFLARLIAALDA